MQALTPYQLLEGRTVALNAKQLNNAVTIIEIFTRRGYTASVAMAAVANAWAESRLGEWNEGDIDEYGVPHAIGLFQLSDGLRADGSVRDSAAGGFGMSKAARLDPIANTEAIIREMIRGGSRVVAAGNGRSATAYFTTDIERPADADAKASERQLIAAQLFPAYIDLPTGAVSVSVPMVAQGALAVRSAVSAAGTSVPGGWWSIGGLLLLAGGIIYLRRWR